MDRSHRTPDRLLSAEPLEGRWLFSGEASNANSNIFEVFEGRSGTVRVHELEPATDDDDAVSIDLSQVPPKVLAAFNDRFAGAKVSDAEMEIDDGVLEFDITAEHNGQIIDVSLTEDGEITETARTIEAGALPIAVLEWLRAQYPDAEIDEAEAMTENNVELYEVTFERSDGTQFEATVGLSPAPIQPPINEEAIVPSEISANLSHGPDTAAVDADSTTYTAVAADDVPGEAAEHVDPPAPPPAESDFPMHSATRADAGEQLRDDIWIDEAFPVATSLEALATGAGAAVWIPEVATMISDVLPFSATSVEQGLGQLLSQIDSAAENVLLDATGYSTPAKLAAIAAILSGAQLVQRHSARRRRPPLLVVNAAESSWSWILGAADQKRS